MFPGGVNRLLRFVWCLAFCLLSFMLGHFSVQLLKAKWGAEALASNPSAAGLRDAASPSWDLTHQRESDVRYNSPAVLPNLRPMRLSRPFDSEDFIF